MALSLAIGALCLTQGIYVEDLGDRWIAHDRGTRKQVWSIKAASGTLPAIPLGDGSVILARTEKSMLARIRPNGLTAWSVPFERATADPLPIWSDGSTIVYRVGNLAWPAYPSEGDYRDELEERWIEARSVASGKRLWRHRYFYFGMPLGLSGRSLVKLRPADPHAYHLGKPTHFVVGLAELATGNLCKEWRLPATFLKPSVWADLYGSYETTVVSGSERHIYLTGKDASGTVYKIDVEPGKIGLTISGNVDNTKKHRVHL